MKVTALLVALVMSPVGCGPSALRPGSVPVPDLSTLEARVRSQLEEGRQRFDSRMRGSSTAGEKAQAYGELGTLYHAYGFFAAARVCYQNALQLAPGEHPWPYALARLAWIRGDLEESTTYLRTALELQPESSLIQLRLAEVAFEKNDLDRAARLYRSVLTSEAQNAAAHLGLGKIALARRAYRAACTSLLKVLSLDPQASTVHYPLARAYRALEEPAQAEEHISRRGPRKVAVVDPMEMQLSRVRVGTRAEWIRAGISMRFGDSEEAIPALARFVDNNTESAEARVSLAEALIQEGELTEARAHFQKVLRSHPKNPDAHTGLGVLYSVDGQDEKAAAEFQKALQANPSLLHVRLNLVNALRRSGRFAQTLDHYRFILEADPSNVEAHHGRVFTLLRVHQYRECAARLAEARNALPEDLRLAQVEARLLAASPEDSMRDSLRAVELAKRVLQKSQTPEHLATWAMALAESQDYDKAARVQRAAITVARERDPELLEGLEKNLARYEKGVPCREPWPDSDPLLSPLPLRHGKATILRR
ncbi:MAG: tetratricopeptide repeat protein [Planctomycetota bacterium]